MKRLYCLSLLLLLVITASAQTSRTKVYDEQTNSITITRVVPKFVDKHDLRLGAGSVSLVSSVFLQRDIDYQNGNMNDLRNEVLEANTYLSKAIFTGPYSLSYTYHSRNWLMYGGTVSFAAATMSSRDNYTKEKVRNYNSYMVSVMPTVRFVYLYRENVQLYSAVSLGVVFGNDLVIPWGDATLFGCSFGRKIFGFAELGAGVGGWGRVGIGYRFDAKSKK